MAGMGGQESSPGNAGPLQETQTIKTLDFGMAQVPSDTFKSVTLRPSRG